VTEEAGSEQSEAEPWAASEVLAVPVPPMNGMGAYGRFLPATSLHGR
jgi:hypothetical protein